MSQRARSNYERRKRVEKERDQWSSREDRCDGRRGEGEGREGGRDVAPSSANIKRRNEIMLLIIIIMERALGIRNHKNNVIAHFECVKRMFSLYTSEERLNELKNLEDVGTLCAHEHYKMKKSALEGTSLNYEEFHPGHFRGLKNID